MGNPWFRFLDNILRQHLFSVPQPTRYFSSLPFLNRRPAQHTSGYRIRIPPRNSPSNSGVMELERLQGLNIQKNAQGSFFVVWPNANAILRIFLRDIPQKLPMVWSVWSVPKMGPMTHDPWMPSISLEPGFHYVNHHVPSKANPFIGPDATRDLHAKREQWNIFPVAMTEESGWVKCRPSCWWRFDCI